MGLLNFLKNLFATPNNYTLPQTAQHYQDGTERKLTYAEKELLAVKRTTPEDVYQLSGFPYSWNRPIEKFIEPHGHPFVYMDIEGQNISIARLELERMNILISQSKALCNMIPKSLHIPVTDIIFKRSKVRGYSRIICSPITYLGEPSAVPITLSFMTDLEKGDSTHGELCYGQCGNILKATIYFWRRGKGYFFYYETVDEQLVLSRIEIPNSIGEKIVIYKGAHILALEAKRAQEERDFEWIKQNFPAKAPKNVTGFRRMKTQNTKNYQTLKQLAAEKGKEI